MSRSYELVRTTRDVELERIRFAGADDSYLDEVPGVADDEDDEDEGGDLVIPPQQNKLDDEEDEDDEIDLM